MITGTPAPGTPLMFSERWTSTHQQGGPAVLVVGKSTDRSITILPMGRSTRKRRSREAGRPLVTSGLYNRVFMDPAPDFKLASLGYTDAEWEELFIRYPAIKTNVLANLAS